MLQIKAKVLYNKKVQGNYFRCILSAPPIARKVCPGQFLNIKVSSAVEPLLRRPFSIHNIGRRSKTGGQIGILYEVVGVSTEILSRKHRGEYLDVIGPLGSGFTLDMPQAKAKKRPIIVAGGMGVAPLTLLAGKLAEAKAGSFKPIVLIGAKTKNQILCEKEFRDYGYEVKIATDDGSKGFKGKVTELLEQLLSTMNYGLSTIYACGPKPMLKAIAEVSGKYSVPAQISLEAHMACGIGACLGCVVDTTSGYKRVCKEGPVFNAEEIIW